MLIRSSKTCRKQVSTYLARSELVMRLSRPLPANLHAALRHALPARPWRPAVTNIRNTTSPRWRAWLGPKNCCLVPFTFCEYADIRPCKTPTWFAGDECRPLLAFAGI